jgi:hypothetical protein
MPTDTMPPSRWAMMLMVAEAAASLVRQVSGGRLGRF